MACKSQRCRNFEDSKPNLEMEIGDVDFLGKADVDGVADFIRLIVQLSSLSRIAHYLGHRVIEFVPACPAARETFQADSLVQSQEAKHPLID